MFPPTRKLPDTNKLAPTLALPVVVRLVALTILNVAIPPVIFPVLILPVLLIVVEFDVVAVIVLAVMSCVNDKFCAETLPENVPVVPDTLPETLPINQRPATLADVVILEDAVIILPNKAGIPTLKLPSPLVTNVTLP